MCRAYDGPVWWGPDTVEASLGQMLKAYSRVLTNNNAVWWFDMWGGWYRDPRFMDFHRKACALYREHVLAGGSRSAAETAVFMDDASFCRIKPTGSLSAMQNHLLWKTLGAVGAPYRLYMLEDLPQVDPAAFRMAVFVSVCDWTEERLRALEAWKGADRVLAFWGPWPCPAASGVEAQTFPGTEDLIRRRTEGANQAQNGDALYFSDKAERQSVPEALTPVIRWTAAPGDVILEQDELGPRSLLRRGADYSVHVDAAAFPPAPRIRELLDAAGGQLYTCEGDVAYASGTHIAVHAASEGVKRIHVPGKGRLVNALTGEALPGNESFVDVPMARGETLLMRVEAID